MNLEHRLRIERKCTVFKNRVLRGEVYMDLRGSYRKKLHYTPHNLRSSPNIITNQEN